MLFATRTETPRRWRVGVWITAAGALVVLIGMSLPWFTVVRAVGPVTQTAWQEYQRTDLLLAALAVGGAAAVFVPRAGWSRAARLVCAGLGFLAVARVIVKSSPHHGAYV